jgi:2-iminobutanoate/2-iminopropanoate deaminase
MMSKSIIETKHAPSPAGAYSQGTASGNIVWVSGQVALDPATGLMCGGDDVGLQTEQALKNLFAVLEASGASPADIVKATVFITDREDFAAMNQVYERLMPKPFPARSTVSVKPFPLGIKVEIECMAIKS